MNKYSSNRFGSAKDAEHLASRLFLLLAILFIGFIVIASLTPQNRANVSLEERSETWFRNWPSIKETFSYRDLRDIATNVLLYIPLGIFVSLSVSWKKTRVLAVLLLLGPVVSLSMEITQAYIGRYPDPLDLAANTTGFLFGFFMVVFAVKRFGLRPSSFLGIDASRKIDKKTKAVASLRFLYICLYFIVALVPFDISVHFSEVYSQLFDVENGTRKIILNPFHHFEMWWGGRSLRLFLEFLGIVPVAVLTSLLDIYKNRLNALSPVYTCVVLAFLSEASQLFILSRTSDIIMFPIAVLAGLFGWGLLRVRDSYEKIRPDR